MLEVGRIQVGGKMHVGWNRAHFGAWCVVSAPLILGLDVSNDQLVEPIVDIITNAEAIAVNQVSCLHRHATEMFGGEVRLSAVCVASFVAVV